MSNIPRVNLGQSEFQDVYMVLGEESFAFRRLRKLELHIGELEASLKENHFRVRKTNVKIKRLNKEDELEAIEIEELEYGLESGAGMIDDAQRRLANFIAIRTQLIESTPQEYWDAGFEAAECDHWIGYYVKKVALEKLLTGQVSMSTLEQILVLPREISSVIMLSASKQENEYIKIAAAAPDNSASLQKD